MRRYFGVFRGRTVYEIFAWRFYVTVPYWRFLKAGSRPRLGFDTTPAADTPWGEI